MGNQNAIQHSISIQNWNQLKTPVDIAPREGACSAVIGEKIVAFGGGYKTEDGPQLLNQVLIFSQQKGTWTELRGSIGTAPSPKTGACCAIVDDKLFVFGGQTSRGWTNEFHMLDLQENQWTVIQEDSQTPCARDKMSCATVGKKIYFFGGFGALSDNDMEELDEEDEEDEEADEEEQEEGESQPRGPCANFSWFQDFYVFDTEVRQWRLIDDAAGLRPSPRAAFGMCTFDHDKIFVCGGRDPEGRKSDIAIYDTSKNKWLQPPPQGLPPSGRSFHTCAAPSPDAKRVLLFGGLTAESQHMNDLHVFDIEPSAWYQPHFQSSPDSKPLIPARGFHISGIIGSQLIVFSGSSDYNPQLGEPEKYLNDTWALDITSIIKADPVDPKQATAPQPPESPLKDSSCTKQNK